jgi:hypothetical protein
MLQIHRYLVLNNHRNSNIIKINNMIIRVYGSLKKRKKNLFNLLLQVLWFRLLINRKMDWIFNSNK